MVGVLGGLLVMATFAGGGIAAVEPVEFLSPSHMASSMSPVHSSRIFSP